MSVGQTLRRRWWVAPVVVCLVALGVIIHIITTPLTVSANLGDGEQAVSRTASIDLRFNQDMKPASVQQAFSLTPNALITFKPISSKEFQFRPTMQPDTTYHARVTNAEAEGGGHVSSAFSFKTEPAPTVSAVSLGEKALQDGQRAVRPQGQIQLAFSQAMDQSRTPVMLNGNPLGPKVHWAADHKSATLEVSLSHSRAYDLLIPQSAVNEKQDPFVADWKFGFATAVEVPSAGDPARIGSGAPVLIQIDNIDGARPQAGMQQADLIYEYISEGSVPRLTAVYWHPLPDLVGPVRSCRLITIRLELMYRGMIYCSGANDYILGMVWKFPNLVNDYSRGAGNVFYRDWTTRYAPHNVMMHGANTSAYTAAQSLPGLDYDIAPAHPDGTFTGDPATRIVVPDHAAVWQYDPSSKQYFKAQDGRPFQNVGTGRVHARTVIVQFVTSYLDRNPANTFHGYHTEAYEMTGTGRADIYTDGVLIRATWQHPDPNVPTIYLDAKGEPIDLDTGLTWVHVIGSQKWHSGL